MWGGLSSSFWLVGYASHGSTPELNLPTSSARGRTHHCLCLLTHPTNLQRQGFSLAAIHSPPRRLHLRNL
jgi:hypothetical protein